MKAPFTLLLAILAIPLFSLRAQTVPTPDHVVVVMMENHGYSQIIGSSSAPYINSLATDSFGALFTNSHGVTHPSQPNYMWIFSGDNQNVILDYTPLSFLLPFSTGNLGAELLQNSRTFVGYSEDLPSVGFTGDVSGNYARKHSPWICWQDGTTNGIPAALNQPFTSFPTNYANLPTLSFVIPNLNDDMHNGTIPQGDTWLQTNIDGYAQWAKTHNSLLIITFDEDDNLVGNNQIATVFVGQMVKAGQYNENIDHTNVLRTMQDMYSLPYAGTSANSSAIVDCWVYKPVSAFTGAPLSICPHQQVTFTDHSTNTPTQWSWHLPGSNIGSSTAANPTATYDTAGTYDVWLITSNHMGPDTLKMPGYVHVLPSPALTLSTDSTGICRGDTVSVTASGAATYHWFPSAGLLSSNGNNMIAAPLSNAVYKVTGNTSGCKGDTATVIISVHPLPVITTSADSQHICAGDTATLSAYGAQSYVWSPTTGLNTTLGSVVTASPASDMTYTVIGTDSNSCSAPSVPLHVIVSTAQQPIISAVDSALSSSAASSYQWYLNGVALPSDTSRDLIATASGVYQVLIYNPQGCSAISDTLRFTLSPSGIPDITSTKAFTIYPNPVNGECHIVSSSLVAKNSFVMIHDLTGRIVKTIPLSGIDTAFQTDEMSAGMYICSIVSAGKVMSSQKLIVQ